jgi:hypothetical protein
MSNLRKTTIENVMPLLDKWYESFGIRSMIVLNVNEWINVVTVIQLTRRKVEDLNSEHSLTQKRLGNVDNDNFKIIFQARPISAFSYLISELQTNLFKIGDLRTRLLVKDAGKLCDTRISEGRVIRSGEYAEYDCYSARLSMDNTPEGVLLEHGISPLSLGLKDFNEVARSWLDLENLGESVNIHIIFPIYAKISGIQYQGGNEIKVTMKMSSRLSDNSHVWLYRTGQADNAPILERTKYDVASLENANQDGFVYTTLRHDFSTITQNDRIFAALLHDELGLLSRDDLWMTILSSERRAPFLQMFSLFDAAKKMEEHLLNPADAEDFANAVTWLLECIDVRCFKLAKGETIRENKTEMGSADIIAFCSNEKEIIAIDCTIGVPQEPKIDKIKNTAEYVSRKIGLPVRAMIFTSKKAMMVKESANKCNVKVIDYADLDRVIGFYRKGHDWPARKVILEDS